MPTRTVAPRLPSITDKGLSFCRRSIRRMTGPLPASWDYRISLGNSQRPTLHRDEPRKECAMPVKKEDLPATIKRSSKEARETYSKALDSAHEQYDSEERAHRTAIAALKHKFEKVGDRWVKKERKGPSDERAATGKGETAG